MNIIVATELNGGIGRDGVIPWQCPEDLNYFAEKTRDSSVIMGRKTFDSLNRRPLKWRRNIVISSNPSTFACLSAPENLVIVPDFDAAIAASEPMKEIFFIGGESIYEKALQIVRRVYVSRIQIETECDTFFPPMGDNSILSEQFELISAKYVEGLKVDHIREVYDRRIKIEDINEKVEEYCDDCE
jgi:dihydrofolate reductase